MPFAEALTLNASGRYTHYESYGSGTTYKIGGLYSPTRWLSFRGSYGTSYRAPALFEQFLGATSGFQPQTVDPCNNLFDVTNPTIITNCLADGLPPNFIQNNGVNVLQRGGADAGLEAETSKNLTLGFVFQPTLGPAFGNLSLAVDYFRVEINDGVGQLAVTTILAGLLRRLASGILPVRHARSLHGSGDRRALCRSDLFQRCNQRRQRHRLRTPVRSRVGAG